MNSAAPEQAAAAFSQGFNCAQSVLAAFADSHGLPRPTALRLAAPFGGGIGGLGETCGAVTGALMVLGLQCAKIDPQDKAAKQANYALARRFIDEFKKRRGSATCRELLGCDISTPEGMQKARDQKLFTTLCPRLVKDAAEIVEQLLAAPMPGPEAPQQSKLEN